jgi:TPP-dependent 2-oxoacid decarboxylase
MSQAESITVARNLMKRPAEIGIGHLFNVPGDSNLIFFDSVIEADRTVDRECE